MLSITAWNITESDYLPAPKSLESKEGAFVADGPRTLLTLAWAPCLDLETCGSLPEAASHVEFNGFCGGLQGAAVMRRCLGPAMPLTTNRNFRPLFTEASSNKAAIRSQ